MSCKLEGNVPLGMLEYGWREHATLSKETDSPFSRILHGLELGICSDHTWGGLALLPPDSFPFSWSSTLPTVFGSFKSILGGLQVGVIGRALFFCHIRQLDLNVVHQISNRWRIAASARGRCFGLKTAAKRRWRANKKFCNGEIAAIWSARTRYSGVEVSLSFMVKGSAYCKCVDLWYRFVGKRRLLDPTLRGQHPESVRAFSFTNRFLINFARRL